MKQHPTLYKRDSKGNTRIWYMESDNGRCYRSVSGIKNGKHATSGWIYPVMKNMGKSNQTTIEEQTDKEIAAEYEYQLNQGKYHANESDIDNENSFVVPMLAVTYDAMKHVDFPYIADGKLDGARMIGYHNTAQSRTGKKYVSVPHIVESISMFVNDFPGFCLDGELYNHDLKDDFEYIISLIRKTKNITPENLGESRNKIKYYVYDIIPPTPMSALQRKQWLDKNVSDKYPFIVVNEWSIVNSVSELNDRIEKDISSGFEGTMLRSTSGLYKPKRDKNLIKCKTFIDIEVKVLDILPGSGVWSEHAKIVTIQLEDGSIQNSNIIGDFAKLKDILQNKEKYIGGDATVKFQGYTIDNKLRFPYIKILWGTKRDI